MISNACFEHLLVCWNKSNGLIAHQIQSFDRFLETKLQEILCENSQLIVEPERAQQRSVLTFERIFIRSPAIREANGDYRRITPHECRLRGLSYNFTIYVNVLHEIFQNNQLVQAKRYVEVNFAKIPCMVRSKACSLRYGDNHECPLDSGGYFVVNGNEKAVVCQEKLRTNFIFVKQSNPKLVTAEIRSLHSTKTRSTSTLIVILTARTGLRGEAIEVRLPFVDLVIPAGIIFRLLGFRDLKEICTFIEAHSPDWSDDIADVVRRSLDHWLVQESRAHLVEHLGKEGTKEATMQRRTRYIEHIITNEFLPHQGLDASESVLQRKALFFAAIIVKMIRVYTGQRPADDRDDYSLKRIETTGGLFALLFRQLFRQYLKMLQLQLTRAHESNKTINLPELLAAKKITAGLKYAVSTGNWGIQKQSSQNGVAQMLTRMNFLAAVSHLRRVNTPINREGKLPKPRQLSASHCGILCPVESPEGQACGLVENLALLTHVRLGYDGALITSALLQQGLMQLPDCSRPSKHLWRISINGSIEGFVEDGMALLQKLKQWRRNLSLPPDSSLTAMAQQKLVLIDTDAGCLMRPLFVKSRLHRLPALIAQNMPWILWNVMLIEGVVELLDKNEEQTIVIGETHIELHPSCMLGICAGQIPFLNHNQAPRNIYESAMCKQAIGMFSLEANARIDTVAHSLHYAQRPLVQTSIQALSACAEFPSGANVVVAVLSYSGFNQEDSIIMSQDALDRGLFRSIISKCWKDEEKSIGSDVERFGAVPPSSVGFRKADYSKVGEDGLPLLGTEVTTGDVIISKRMQTSQLGTDRKKHIIQVDHSTILSASEPMRVGNVYLSSNKDGARLVRIKLQASRTPEIGDKFSSHHGQKGVIGIVLKGIDMPFTIDGVCPDLIINPHALPGRMTVGQLVESLLGKLCCLAGRVGNGTPFNGLQTSQIGAELQTYGFHSRGQETMFNGFSGEPLDAEVYVGVVHYQRLRHCVIDKVHARSRGPVQLITRQPVEGRSRGGGLRVGEMERDCMLAHGASAVILDRLFKQSDEFQCCVCRRCGLIGEELEPEHGGRPRIYCRGCRLTGAEHLARVHLPYSMKLLAQECAGLNVALRFRLEEKGKEKLGL